MIDSMDPVGDVLRRRDEAVKEALAGLTLRSLALGQSDAPKERATSPRDGST